MKILKAIFTLSIAMSFLFLAFKIFSEIHCRQETWHESFKSQTQQLIGKRSFSQGKCKTKNLYHLTLRLGENL